MKHKNKHQSIRQPQYPGGNKALTEFIKKNLIYPESAKEQRIKGVVRVKADINKVGRIIKTTVIAGIGHGCDEEAQRVIKLLEFKVPENRGMRVTFHKQFNVSFNPPPEPPKQAQQLKIEIKYHVTKSAN